MSMNKNTTTENMDHKCHVRVCGFDNARHCIAAQADYDAQIAAEVAAGFEAPLGWVAR